MRIKRLTSLLCLLIVVQCIFTPLAYALDSDTTLPEQTELYTPAGETHPVEEETLEEMTKPVEIETTEGPVEEPGEESPEALPEEEPEVKAEPEDQPEITVEPEVTAEPEISAEPENEEDDKQSPDDETVGEAGESTPTEAPEDSDKSPEDQDEEQPEDEPEDEPEPEESDLTDDILSAVEDIISAALDDETFYTAVYYSNNFPSPSMGNFDDLPGNRFAIEGGNISINYASGYKSNITTSELELPQYGRIPGKVFTEWYVFGDVDAYPNGAAAHVSEWVHTAADVPLSNYDGKYEMIGSKIKVRKSAAKEITEKMVHSNQLLGSDIVKLKMFEYNSLPLIAEWSDSNRAELYNDTPITLTGGGETLKLYKFTENIDPSVKMYSKTKTELDQINAGFSFSADESEYYVRVASDVDSISIDLSAFEPYLNFQWSMLEKDANGKGVFTTVKTQETTQENVSQIIVRSMTTETWKQYITEPFANNADSPVRVLSDNLPVNCTVKHTIENDGLFYDKSIINLKKNGSSYVLDPEVVPGVPVWQPQNSVSKPAYSTWKFTDIQLAPSTASNPYNEIEVVISPPDGGTSKSYTFYIQRVAEPSASLAPGNTPAGVVARDPDEHWRRLTSLSVEEAKSRWLTYFTNNHVIWNDWDASQAGNNNPNTAKGAINNGGALYDGTYLGAWTDEDLDLDPEALVAYQNYSFTDSGLTILTSAGTLYTGEVERRLKLSVPKSGYSMLDALIFNNMDYVYYINDTLQTITNADDAWESVPVDDLTIDLREKLVLPGIYTLEYRYVDDYNGMELSRSRPLVVLPPPGDVDMDGVTTTADADALYYLISLNGKTGRTEFTNPINPAVKLFKARVCNVSGTDGTRIDINDVKALENGFRPRMLTMRAVSGAFQEISVSDYFYVPLSSMDERYDRINTLDTTTSGVPMTLSKHQETGTLGNMAGNTSLQEGSIFWVDVELGKMESYTSLKSFTYSVAYDKRYVRPATASDLATIGIVLSADDLNRFGGYSHSSDVTWKEWASVVWKYNLSSTAETPWRGAYSLTDASEWNAPYDTHFSKPKTGLEIAVGANNLSEVIFSIKLDEGKAGASLTQTGSLGETVNCLLRLPFIMHTFPSGNNGTNELPLVAFDLGLHEFVLASEKPSVGAVTDEYADNIAVAAYSNQSSIYGGHTDNLRTQLYLTRGADTLYYSLGLDNSDAVELVNYLTGQTAVYGEEFKCSPGTIEAIVDGELPPGLRLDSYSIVGYPTKAGEYRFKFSDRSYYNKITVRQKELHVWPNSEYTYYGEGDFTSVSGSAYEQLINHNLDSANYSGATNNSGEYYRPELMYMLQYSYDPADLAVIRASGGVGAASREEAAAMTDGYYVFEGNRISEGHANDGTMQSLLWLITNGGKGTDGATTAQEKIYRDSYRIFNHPTLTTEHNATSTVGDYSITMTVQNSNDIRDLSTGTMQNYKLVVDTAQARKAKVHVVPRPVIATELHFAANDPTQMPLYQLLDADSPTILDESLTRATLGDGKQQFSMVAAIPGRSIHGGKTIPGSANTAEDNSGRKLVRYTVSDSVMQFLPLSEDGQVFDTDTLTLSFVANVTVTADDVKYRQPQKTFYVPADDEDGMVTRSVGFTNPALMYDGVDNICANYDLVVLEKAEASDPDIPIVEDAAVIRRLAVKFVYADWSGADFNINHGDTLAMRLQNSIIAGLDWGGYPATKTVTYSDGSGLAEEKMFISVVTLERKEADLAALEAVNDDPNVIDKSIPFGDEATGVYSVNKILDATPTSWTDDQPKLDQRYCLRIAYVPVAHLDENNNILGDSRMYNVTYSNDIIDSNGAGNGNGTRSAGEVVINKLTIHIAPQPITRYYGEDTESKIDFTFDVKDIAACDRPSGLSGVYHADKLKEILGSDFTFDVCTWNGTTRPTNSRVGDARHYNKYTYNEFYNEIASKDPITPYTPYTGGTALLVAIGNAKHRNYNFTYDQRFVGSETYVSNKFGYAGVRIERRPVVVKSMTGLGSLADVYADLTGINKDGRIVQAREYSCATNEGGVVTPKVTFELPTITKNVSGENVVTYYTRSGTTANEVTSTMDLTGDAILADDVARMADLVISCNIGILPDGMSWSGITNGHFRKVPVGMPEGYAGSVVNYNAEITDMIFKSTGVAGVIGTNQIVNNYTLVFKDASDAQLGCPTDVTLYSRVENSGVYEYENYTGGETCRVAGYVRVHSRPITAIRIVNAPKLVYDYGDPSKGVYLPTGLGVELTFAKKAEYGGGLDTSRVGNAGSTGRITSDHTVEINWTRTQNRVYFEEFGILPTLWNRTSNSSPYVDVTVPVDSYVTPAEHTGVRFKVSSIYTGGPASDLSDFQLTVNKKQINLRVAQQDRYYGEDNYSVQFATTYGTAEYEFYFDIRELVGYVAGGDPLENSDYAVVLSGNKYATIVTPSGSVNYAYGYAAKGANGVASTCSALTHLSDSTVIAGQGRKTAFYTGKEYSAPTFSTYANKNSPVVNGGLGGYELALSGGSMANYEFTYTNNLIHVYKRPIAVTQIYSGYTGKDSTSRAVYSIFDTGGTQESFTRQLPYKEKARAAGVSQHDAEGFYAEAGTEFKGYVSFDRNNPTAATVLATPQPGHSSSAAYSGWQWFEIRNGEKTAPGSAAVLHTPTETNAAAATNVRADGTRAVFYLSSEGVIGDDNPSITLTMEIKQSDYANVNAAKPIPAEIKSLALARTGSDEATSPYNNYVLREYDGEDVAGSTQNNLFEVARAEARQIEKIRVIKLPDDHLSVDADGNEYSEPWYEYTYGETLDLAGLRVLITYKSNTSSGTGSGTNPDNNVTISYPSAGTAGHFAEYGLTVSYVDFASAPTVGSESDNNKIKDLPSDYREAASGDHMTIDPLHDNFTNTDQVGKKYEVNNFAANKKYLIISARTTSDTPVQPKMIGTTAEDLNSEESKPGQQMTVKPLELDYELRAEDKVYDRTTRANGSIKLTNVYTGDLVYIDTQLADNENYKGTWTWASAKSTDSGKLSLLKTATSNWTDYTFRTYKSNVTGMKFNFADANVRYEDGDYPGATEANLVKKVVVDGESVDYWQTEQHYDHDVWEFSPAKMPVDVTGLVLGGPDKNNYTFRANNTNNPVHNDSISGNARINSRVGQDSAPYATITKATRPNIDPVEFGRPKLEIDDATGVVRVLFEDMVLADNEEIKDFYHDELHMEFAIEYFNEDSDLPIYYCFNSENGYWDTFYFGGEAVGNTVRQDSPVFIYPNGDIYGDDDSYLGYRFYPKDYKSDTQEPSEYSGNAELLGQLYKWTNTDYRINPSAIYQGKDKSGADVEYKLLQYIATDEKGEITTTRDSWAKDEGFEFHVADPNVSPKSIKIGNETYYYFYGYYTTDRDPIPRGAYVLGKVRLSETHNYTASDPLYTTDKYTGASAAGSEAAIAALKAETDSEVQLWREYLADVAKRGRETAGVNPLDGYMEDMVHMFEYRIDLLDSQDKQSSGSEDKTLYDVRVLHAVRFTDYSEYKEMNEMTAAVKDDTTRFFNGYYWDDRYQKALEFTESDPIILGVLKVLEITRDIIHTDGTRESITRNENFNDSTTVQLFITQGGTKNPIERWIKIHPESVTARLGDDPIKLTVEFFPKLVPHMQVKWTSSNEDVARVTEDGMLEFIGLGYACITATSFYGKTCSIDVYVNPPLPDKQSGVFNREALSAYMGLSSDYFFYPDREMTRGEFVCLAAFFFLSNDEWERFGSGDFVDVVGDESYAEAVALLGRWGIVNGVGEDRFAGELIATRAEAAAIIARMLGIDPGRFVNTAPFADSSVTDTWASGYIGGLHDQGVVEGNGNDLFAPNRGITRAEAAAMFYRTLNYKGVSSVLIKPKDVPETHWAYSAIIRAINPGEPVLDDGTERGKGE